MHGEERPNIKTQLIIGTLKFDEFQDNISIDYGLVFELVANNCVHLFYKIKLRNMLWRWNRIWITWYKHDNWPITAYVKHNLFYKL